MCPCPSPGEYTLSGNVRNGGPLTLTFTSERSWRDCCSVLAGGVRGVFRTVVDKPAAGAAARSAAAAAGAPSAAAAPAPAAPPGWQVLRSNKAGPVGGSSSTSTGAVARARPVVLEDAWGDDDDGGALRAGRGRAGALGGSGSGYGAGGQAGAGPEPRNPWKGPAMDLAGGTAWDALDEEDA